MKDALIKAKSKSNDASGSPAASPNDKQDQSPNASESQPARSTDVEPSNAAPPGTDATMFTSNKIGVYLPSVELTAVNMTITIPLFLSQLRALGWHKSF